MEQSTQELYETTAKSALDLAVMGQDAVSEGDFNKAASVYALLNEVSYSMAAGLRLAATNELKRQVLPEDMLEEKHTGAEQPLHAAEGIGSGQYL